MDIKAILFDYDGVIVDSFPSVFEVYKKICNKFNVECPQEIEQFRKAYGYNYKECLKNLGIKEQYFNQTSEIYKNEIVKENHKLFNNIKKVIINLSKKYKLFLVSASYKQEVFEKLSNYKLIEYFKKIYCGADHKIKKSEIIKNILKDNNFTKKEIISIGDRTIDYNIAKKIGLDDNNIVIVSYGWGYDKKKLKIKNIAHNPDDILKIINNLI